MQFCFECDCGGTISDFTRGATTDISTDVACSSCHSMHEVTIMSITDGLPSHVVPRAIAASTNTPVDELEPIGRSVDLEAIDALLTDSEMVRVTFAFDDLQVQVEPESIVVLNQHDGTDDR